VALFCGLAPVRKASCARLPCGPTASGLLVALLPLMTRPCDLQGDCRRGWPRSHTGTTPGQRFKGAHRARSAHRRAPRECP
jgi:hypothetical protein